MHSIMMALSSAVSRCRKENHKGNSGGVGQCSSSALSSCARTCEQVCVEDPKSDMGLHTSQPSALRHTALPLQQECIGSFYRNINI